MLKVTLLACTSEPERIVATAARRCYSTKDVSELYDDMDEAETGRFLDMFMSLGHSSLSEHAVFTFAVDGVSRVLLAQITRHRIASFAVRSQRYTSQKAFEPVVPPEIAGIPEAAAIFAEGVEDSRRRYNELVAILEKKHAAALSGDPDAAKKAKKLAGEDARYLLPSACETSMVVTMNARELRHFFELRLCRRAQWEIRALALEMLRLAREAAPRLFVGAGPRCLHGACPEGAMTCGHVAEVRAEFGRG